MGTMKNIASALVKAQRGFAPALKTSTNPHFRSKYVDLAGCVEAVVDSLNAAGIALIQRTSQDDTGVTVETVFVHESGEMLECGKLHVPASKQDPQGYGSALTYARRYSLMAACGIAPEDDDGNAASRKREVVEKSEPNVKFIEEQLGVMAACKTVDELKLAYTGAYACCDGDQAWQAKVITAKNKRYKEITNA
jgi:ERF superfamily